MNKKPDIVYLRGRKPKENIVVFLEVDKTLRAPFGDRFILDSDRGITKRRKKVY